MRTVLASFFAASLLGCPGTPQQEAAQKEQDCFMEGLDKLTQLDSGRVSQEELVLLIRECGSLASRLVTAPAPLSAPAPARAAAPRPAPPNQSQAQ